MTTTVITLKLTGAEIALIDALLPLVILGSRSEVMRLALIRLAERYVSLDRLVMRAEDERSLLRVRSAPGVDRYKSTRGESA